MNYKDRTVNQGSGYEDTNINVFVFGSLPLNDVFGYGGNQAFTDRKFTEVATTITVIKTASSGAFSDRKTTSSEPILSQDGGLILSQDEDYYIGFYRGALSSIMKEEASDNFTNIKTNE